MQVPDLTDSLGSVKFYKEWGKVYGLDFVEFVDHTIDLATHYEMVRATSIPCYPPCFEHLLLVSSSTRSCTTSRQPELVLRVLFSSYLYENQVVYRSEKHDYLY